MAITVVAKLKQTVVIVTKIILLGNYFPESAENFLNVAEFSKEFDDFLGFVRPFQDLYVFKI